MSDIYSANKRVGRKKDCGKWASRAEVLWIETYGAVERSSFLLRMGSDMVSGGDALGTQGFFLDREGSRWVWVGSTAAANFGKLHLAWSILVGMLFSLRGRSNEAVSSLSRAEDSLVVCVRERL